MKWSVGIDLGGTNIEAGLVNDRLELVDRVHEKTRAPRSARSLAGSLADSVRRLLDRQGIQASQLEAIGIGLPGMVDSRTGKLLYAANLGLEEVDFPSLMADYFPQTPVLTGNDADCAVLAEYMVGGARGYDSALLLTLGTGLGGGFIYQGRIFRGGDGWGIEPGHMVLVAGEGWPCSCGQAGCFEAYVSIRGLKRLVQEALVEDRSSLLRDWMQPEGASFNARLVFDAVQEGDPLALEVLESYVHYLALGIRSLVVLYRPEIILLGGGISRAGDLLCLPLEAAVRRTSFAGDLLAPPPVRVSRLGNEAGILGAALLHRQL